MPKPQLQISKLQVKKHGDMEKQERGGNGIFSFSKGLMALKIDSGSQRTHSTTSYSPLFLHVLNLTTILESTSIVQPTTH
jgi:hypothetical protein